MMGFLKHKSVQALSARMPFSSLMPASQLSVAGWDGVGVTSLLMIYAESAARERRPVLMFERHGEWGRSAARPLFDLLEPHGSYMRHSSPPRFLNFYEQYPAWRDNAFAEAVAFSLREGALIIFDKMPKSPYGPYQTKDFIPMMKNGAKVITADFKLPQLITPDASVVHLRSEGEIAGVNLQTLGVGHGYVRHAEQPATAFTFRDPNARRLVA